jgi:hypothetical protein
VPPSVKRDNGFFATFRHTHGRSKGFLFFGEASGRDRRPWPCTALRPSGEGVHR